MTPETAVLKWFGQWYGTEKLLWNDLNKGHGLNGEWLYRLLKHFGVARNFRLKCKRTNSEKCKRTNSEKEMHLGDNVVPVIKRIIKLRNYTEAQKVDKLVRCLSERNDEISLTYGKALSASSKILWMHNRDSVVIFDSRVKNQLWESTTDFRKGHKKKKESDYEYYISIWNYQYNIRKKCIDGACKYLGSSIKCLPDNFRVMESDVNSLWFKHRVFDALMWAGAEAPR